jgi:hypothetical protein
LSVGYEQHSREAPKINGASHGEVITNSRSSTLQS